MGSKVNLRADSRVRKPWTCSSLQFSRESIQSQVQHFCNTPGIECTFSGAHSAEAKTSMPGKTPTPIIHYLKNWSKPPIRPFMMYLSLIDGPTRNSPFAIDVFGVLIELRLLCVRVHHWMSASRVQSHAAIPSEYHQNLNRHLLSTLKCSRQKATEAFQATVLSH